MVILISIYIFKTPLAIDFTVFCVVILLFQTQFDEIINFCIEQLYVKSTKYKIHNEMTISINMFITYRIINGIYCLTFAANCKTYRFSFNLVKWK